MSGNLFNDSFIQISNKWRLLCEQKYIFCLKIVVISFLNLILHK